MAKMPYSFGIGLGGILLGAFSPIYWDLGYLHRNGFCASSAAHYLFLPGSSGFIGNRSFISSV